MKRELRPPVTLQAPSPPEGNDSGTGTDNDSGFVMHDAVTPLHNPLLALPLSVIDPGASTTRDEGEGRLPLLRAALFQLQREHKTLCAEGGVGSLVAALTPSVRVHASMHASLFKPDSSWKPRVCLIAPSAHVMAPAEADVMTVEERVQCIPVADDPHGCVAFPNWPLHAPRRLVAHFDARRAGGVGAAATMQMERTGLDRVTMRVSSANGEQFFVQPGNLSGVHTYARTSVHTVEGAKSSTKKRRPV